MVWEQRQDAWSAESPVLITTIALLVAAQGMGVQRYQTTTMGERVVGACRAAGEGAYSILEHGSGTNFVYR